MFMQTMVQEALRSGMLTLSELPMLLLKFMIMLQHVGDSLETFIIGQIITVQMRLLMLVQPITPNKRH